LDEPRPGRPRTVSDANVEAVIVKTLECRPKDATHWSTRSMANEVGLTQPAVHRIWQAFGLEPHRQETWKLSSDPQFIEKVRDIVGLYLKPPERAVVLCMDEKSQIQALDRTAPILDNASTHKAPAIQKWLKAHPTVRAARHPDQLRLAEPRRAVVRRPGRQEAAPRLAPLRAQAQRRHPRLDRHLDENPRPFV
jgi:hypothetical protein